jgi:hypothetical protein
MDTADRTADRIAWLDEMIERTDSDQTRLRAIELREQIAGRQPRDARTTAQVMEEYATSLADDPERLAKCVNLAVQHGLFGGFPAFRALVEREAEELIATERQALREAVRKVNTKEGASDPEDVHEVEEEPEAVEEVEADRPEEVSAEEIDHSLDGRFLRLLRRGRGAAARAIRTALRYAYPGAYVVPGYTHGVLPTSFAALADKKVAELVAFLKGGSGWVTPETGGGSRPE